MASCPAFGQGLKGRHIFVTAFTAGFCDVILIGLGVLGFGVVVEKIPTLIDALRWGGAAFLCFYGFKSFVNACGAESLSDDVAKGMMKNGGLKETVLILLGVSLLNPHVYLDTVVLIGGLAASYGDPARYFFGLGAMAGSFLWFFCLAYGAKILSPLFAKPGAWQVFDILIGITMLAIAASLVWPYANL